MREGEGSHISGVEVRAKTADRIRLVHIYPSHLRVELRPVQSIHCGITGLSPRLCCSQLAQDTCCLCYLWITVCFIIRDGYFIVQLKIQINSFLQE